MPEFSNHLFFSNARPGFLCPRQVLLYKDHFSQNSDIIPLCQDLELPTKVCKGIVSLMEDFVLLNAGEKISLSKYNFMVGIKLLPFRTGLKYYGLFSRGGVYSTKMINMDVVTSNFFIRRALSQVVSLFLNLKIPHESVIPVMNTALVRKA